MTTREEYRARRKMWVEALRSGKYKQIQQRLANGAGFCCLGVACDISGLGTWTSENQFDCNGAEHYGMLPPEVKDWLGMRGRLGSYGANDARAYLSDANDDGVTFAEIADIIEERTADLFILEAV